jgi:uncharacterized protein YhbP (UPF0306 family)
MKKFLPNRVLVQINFYIDEKLIDKMSRTTKQYIYEFDNGIQGVRYKGNFVEVFQEKNEWVSNIYAKTVPINQMEDVIKKIFGDLK